MEEFLAVPYPGSRPRCVAVVTGVSGFLGRAICGELVARGAEVYGVSRTLCGTIPGVRSYRVREYEETPAPTGAVCIHLAGSNDAQNVADRIANERDATLHLAHRLATAGFVRVVYASSAQVYGDGIQDARREDEPLSPGSPYAMVKRAAEEVFLAYGHVVARIANTYGSGMSTANVLSDLLRQIPGEGEVLVRDAAPVRDYIHVQDVARGLACLALCKSQGIFNLGTGVGTSVGELAAMLLRQVGQEGRPVVQLAHGRRPSWMILDPHRMKATFGWAPTIQLEQGLKDLLNQR